MRIEQQPFDAPVQQGDFLHWKTHPDPLYRNSVVVTADCDLARGKHWGKVTVVPVLSVAEYAEMLVAPRILESLRDRLKSTLLQNLKRATKPQVEPGETTLDANAVLLDERFSETWRDAPDVARCCRVLRDVHGYQQYASAKECLKDALLALGYAEEELAVRVASQISSPPGDSLVIPTPPSIGFTFGVAWLRALREVRDNEIVTKLSDWSPGRGMRVARLGPVFRHRMTQKLAQMFSDIGLPDDFEQELKAHIGTVTKALTSR